MVPDELTFEAIPADREVLADIVRGDAQVA
jgi:hypothetical protein